MRHAVALGLPVSTYVILLNGSTANRFYASSMRAILYELEAYGQ